MLPVPQYIFCACASVRDPDPVQLLVFPGSPLVRGGRVRALTQPCVLFKDRCLRSLLRFNCIYMVLKDKVNISMEELTSAGTRPLVEPPQLSGAFFPSCFSLLHLPTCSPVRRHRRSAQGTLNLSSPPATKDTGTLAFLQVSIKTKHPRLPVLLRLF